MTTAAATSRPRGAGRAQLHDTALLLFARHGVEGTSLQAIADEMGVSKAAVYYHYKTKDELVLGVLAPLLAELPAIVRSAGALRGRQARIDAIVSGLVGAAISNRSRYWVIMSDPHVAELLGRQQTLRRWWEDLIALVTGPEPDPAARVALYMFVSSLTTPLQDPVVAALDEADLRRHLIDCGRRLLNVRPRTR
jgi:AcrR family transcriptional regulator